MREERRKLLKIVTRQKEIQKDLIFATLQDLFTIAGNTFEAKLFRKRN